MKSRTLILIVFVFGISICSAQDTTFNSEYFKLIKTYKSIDEVYLVHPELKPQPPHIVIDDDEVLFYDDNRNVIKKVHRIINKEIALNDPNYEKYHKAYKISNYFRVIEGEMLLVNEYYGNEFKSQFKNAKLLDKTGKFIANISKDTDVKISPNKRFFATCYEGEAGIGLVQIFDTTGKRICTNQYDNEAGIEYDRNNNLSINIFNSFQIIIKDEFCNDLVLYDYFGSLNISSLFRVFYFPKLNHLIISTSQNGLFYISIDSKEVLWNKNLEKVEKCIIRTNTKLIIVQTRGVSDRNKPEDKRIKVLDSSNGQIIHNILINKVLLFDNNLIIIEKEGVYYEYEI